MSLLTKREVDIFNDLYFEKELPIRAVANELSMNQATLRYRLKKIGVNLRPRNVAISIAIRDGRRNLNGANNPNYRHGKQVESGVGKRWSKYGISKEQFKEMLSCCNNSCEICGDEFVKTPNIDHCHNTDIVRGLLCSKCNAGIGLLNDNIETLESAVKYLSKARW